VIGGHPDVAECAVIGIADDLKGQLPAGFLILNAGVEKSEAEVEKEVIRLVREEIGPVAAFKIAVTVKRLPKTRSGKILRGVMQKIADGQDYKMPATIDDPAILDEIGDALKARGVILSIIGVGSEVDTSFLEHVASEDGSGGKRYVAIDSYGDLTDVFREFQSLIIPTTLR